jgi:hypothetical protein
VGLELSIVKLLLNLIIGSQRFSFQPLLSIISHFQKATLGVVENVDFVAIYKSIYLSIYLSMYCHNLAAKVLIKGNFEHV